MFNEDETPTKECHDCDAKGRVYENGEPDDQDPNGVECDTCHGNGWLEVSKDEQAFEHECRTFDEVELMNEKYYSKN